MLDHAFRLTLKNFTTYFLLAACITVPLHVGHALVFQRVIAVSEIHDAIEEFPSERQVRGVGKAELRDARLGLVAVTAVEILLLPLLARAARRVLSDDRHGVLPTVRGGWGRPSETGGNLARAWRKEGSSLVVALVLALAIGALAERAGMLLTEPLADQRAWAGVGLAQAAARALAIPFFIVPWGVAAGPLRLKKDLETPNL
ncbi:MAG: hypothetical protein ACRDLB_13610 [Actinomycetota bacterium]